MTPLPRHVVIAALLTLAARDVCAQSTRAEEMAQARRDQEARLWPERESPGSKESREFLAR